MPANSKDLRIVDTETKIRITVSHIFGQYLDAHDARKFANTYIAENFKGKWLFSNTSRASQSAVDIFYVPG